MAYNTKPIVTDVNGNPISQYYNKKLDIFEPVEGGGGANKVILYKEDGRENNLSLLPILDKLSQLTGTVIDEETRKTSELEREQAEVIRNTDETDRQQSEGTRKQDEASRNSQEVIRQTHTSEAIERLDNTNNSFKVWEDYDPAKDYVPMNKVQYKGSSYVNIVPSKGILPTDTTHWTLVAMKGIDGDGAGDMTRFEYDTNNNGIVDLSEDSQKLGGVLADDYSTKTYVDEQITLITETGIPKLNVYEYKIYNLPVGTTELEIPLETYDKPADTVQLIINSVPRDSDFFNTVNAVRDTEGGLLSKGKIVLTQALTKISKATIQVWKNIPIGEEGSVSGQVIAIESLPMNRVQGLVDLQGAISRHMENFNNPHKVTLDQINAMNALGVYIADFNKTIKPGWYTAGQLSENSPPGSGRYGMLLVQVRGIDVHQISIFGSEISARIYSGGTKQWSEWVPLGNCKRLDISDKLLNGWVIYSSVYPMNLNKTGNIVSLNGIIKSGTMTQGTVIVNIDDAEFRPISNIQCPVTFSNGQIGLLLIRPSGAISIQNYTWSFNTEVTISVSYPVK